MWSFTACKMWVCVYIWDDSMCVQIEELLRERLNPLVIAAAKPPTSRVWTKLHPSVLKTQLSINPTSKIDNLAAKMIIYSEAP